MSPSHAVLVLLAAVLVAPAPSSAEVALPDTGLFAPVAAQLAARQAALAALAPGDPKRIALLVETGRAADAARDARRLGGDDPATVAARALAALAVQDFAAAAPLLERLEAQPGAEARGLVHRGDFARDATARIDGRTRARLADGTATVPDLLAAGRLAYALLNYPRADSMYGRALERAAAGGDDAARWRSAAHVGRALVMQKRRQWDESLAEVNRALAEHAT